MATPEHTPKGRGYESWVGYYQHANEYWRKSTVFQATGDLDSCLNKMIDISMHNETYSGGVRDAASLTDQCASDVEADPACYEEHIFKERALDVIKNHDVSKVDEPLFLFYSFHLIHTPLQVPKWWLDKIDQLVEEAGGKPFTSSNRRLYAAMVLYMDAAVGEIVQALKDRGMYDDTLIVFTADNGGPIYEPGAANNHPLLGGKYSDFEGGVRTNAFVSGGFIPKHRRGSKFEGVINVADWYGTFLSFAQVDLTDHKAEKANEWLREKGLPLLPPVDTVPQWEFILSGKNGRGFPMHLSEKALLQWPLKLVTGTQAFGAWTGPIYPNCTTVQSLQNHNGPIPDAEIEVFGARIAITESDEEAARQSWTKDCGAGCLFNVQEDPTEHNDLASHPGYVSKLRSMQDTLKKLNTKLFNPDRGTDRVEACEVALNQGRVFGPFVNITGYYSPPPVRSRTERLSDAVLWSTIQAVNTEPVKSSIIKAASSIAPSVIAKRQWDTCIAQEDFSAMRADIITV